MDNEDFQARIMVEMRMAGRYDQFVILVLKFGQLLGNAVGVMVVDERNGAYYRRIGARRSLGNQAIANQVAKSLGSVGIAEPGDEIIEALEKIRIESDSDSRKDAHARSCEENCLRWRTRSANMRFVAR